MRIFHALGSFTLSIALGFTLGCGSSTSKPATTSTTPSPAPAPGPAPAPPPTPAPVPSTAPDNYSAFLLDSVGRNSFVLNEGKITVDTTANNGAGSVALQSGNPAAPYVVLFCPYPTNYQNIPFQYQNCAVLANFTTTTQAAQTIGFTMPKGTYSGAFLLIQNGVVFGESGMSTSTTGLGFQSAMLPASSITAGIGSAVGPDTGFGAMSTDGTTLKINITGAMPNDTYSVQLCQLNAVCTSAGTLASNSSGSVSGTLATGSFGIFSGVVTLSDAAGVEFISGFRSQ